MFKYLKDQGGQFWGAFSKSLGETVSAERDRPLKEAMMKAQIAHQQAVADKAQMDIQQAREQQQAVTDLAAVLQPKVTTPAISEAPAPVPMAPSGNVPTLTPQMTTPDVKSPEVMSKLAKAQPKEFTAAILKQATGGGMTPMVSTWAEAQALMNDPTFMAANPYGGRWEQTTHGIAFKGIHPVNPEAAIFHTPESTGGGTQGALNYAEKRGATTAAAGVAGKAAQQLGEPIQPVQPFANAQPGQPGQPAPVGQPTPGAPAGPTGESPAMRAKRQQQAITRQESPLPEADKQAIGAASKISAQADLLLNAFTPEEIDKFSGVFNQPIEQGKSYLQAGKKVLGMKPSESSEKDRARFSAWQTALGQMKHVAFDEGGKQLTPFEASIVFSYVPTGNEVNGGVEIRQKIQQMKAFLEGGRAVRARLAKEGRANVDPTELDAIMRRELQPLVQKLQAGQVAPTAGKQPPAGWTFTGK